MPPCPRAPHRSSAGRITIDVVATAHQLLGYVVAMVVLTAGVTGLIQAREARAFSPRVYVIATIVFDVQVLGGLALYVLGGYWGHDSLLLSVVHPVLALLGVSAAHVGLRRSRLQETDVAGHRTAVGGLLLGLLAILLAIAVASMGVRG